MAMPGRNYASPSAYRYGFNGKEDDGEINGDGVLQDYGMRMYDTRLGRFLSPDPLTNKFPYWTPYQFSGDNPIKFVDLDGLEPKSDKSSALKAVDDFSKDDRTSNYLNDRVTKEQFVNDLRNLINDPEQLNQCNSNFCGKATASVALALKDNPEGVANFLIDLYLTGSATYDNGKEKVAINISDNLKGGMNMSVTENKDYKGGNWNSSSLNTAFSVLAYGLTEEYHWNAPIIGDNNYQSGDEDSPSLWAGSTMGTEKKIVGDFFGYSYEKKGSNFTFGFGKENVIKGFESGLQQGKTVLALVSGGPLRTKSAKPKIYGTHWIIITNMSGSKVEYWEYGARHETTRDQLKISIAGGLVIDAATGK